MLSFTSFVDTETLSLSLPALTMLLPLNSTFWSNVNLIVLSVLFNYGVPTNLGAASFCVNKSNLKSAGTLSGSCWNKFPFESFTFLVTTKVYFVFPSSFSEGINFIYPLLYKSDNTAGFGKSKNRIRNNIRISETLCLITDN